MMANSCCSTVLLVRLILLDRWAVCSIITDLSGWKIAKNAMTSCVEKVVIAISHRGFPLKTTVECVMGKGNNGIQKGLAQ